MSAIQIIPITGPDMSLRLQHNWNRLLAETLFWSVTLALLLEDDVAMLAVMFS
ncbi:MULTISPECIES: hypothetical protein [unclassified Herbaspirillum]|uniref:hypothetical protein n=1 Tax=unclassified Herbaspirillum TaxID=2624150 RepID=UPI00160DE0B1|nr:MULTISPECIES: hypothetical protein [unclassified Herbaspirillum]MBB5391130.1 hypothetical protein [Herbaspirillum sp. SJZ102]